ncbi:MAG: hypothetical protein JHC95_06290 [Solirubrobacteraceae bacterium]|nr:hypothetical protein [Solirubrobacteraceae bacterium]
MFVRWDELTIEHQEAAALPGYREPAAVRRFDAPEALDMRFYEIRSKSVLNRVPEKSRMPFRWTINPYRGCSHACVYCLDGETPILLADGRHRALADLRVGDRIYGTRRIGSYRRYVETEVLAHWRSVKQAFRITLADGTELIASGDHRFLTRGGWKHVTGATVGRYCRPHLSTSDTLLGVGAFAPTPARSAEYEYGYRAGMRLEPARVRADELVLAGGLDAVRSAAAWPDRGSSEWERGFVAGMFDAGGSYSGGTLRVATGDPEIVRRATQALTARGFDAGIDTGREGAPQCVRVRGGLREHLRFFHIFDPATTRKRSITGQPLKSVADLRVVAVESLGEMRELFDITTGTGDFIADGVVSHNCFARPTHRYLDFDAGRDFEREIVVKVNAPEAARAELSRPRWGREHVAMGTNTDPYQWVESRYRLMPGIWEALRDTATPASVLTKSPLLLRDADLMLEASEHAPVYADLSIPTWDEKAWRDTEPHTPHPRARMEAVAELNRRGIPTGILIAPLMPGINDDPRQLEPLLAAAAAAGAVQIGGIGLHLRGETRDVFMDWLRACRPDLVERYEELYERGAYLPPDERRRLGRLIKPEMRDPSIELDALESTERFRSLRAQRRGARERRSQEPPRLEPAQGYQAALF